MLNSALLFSVLFSLFAFSLQCETSTFKDTLVMLKQKVYLNGTEVSTKDFRLLINGCLSPETISPYDKTSSPIELTISNQIITRINRRAIADLNNLLLINITYNDIETIEEEAFINLPEVQQIILHSNNISWVPMDAFLNLPKLERIDLRNNSLEVLPQSVFYDLPGLKFAFLNENKFRHFRQEWFRYTPNLTVVEMRYNLIDAIPRGSFITLTNLRALNFFHNQIEFVHFNAFDGLEKLYILDLGSNKIAKFDFNFRAFPNLEVFSLYYNRITFISMEALSLAAGHLYLRLSLIFNPLQCSCFERIMKWAVEHEVMLYWSCDEKNPVCVIPNSQPEKCIARKDEDLYYSNYFENVVHISHKCARVIYPL